MQGAVKGFITDGKENLQRVFEDELKNARSLRCFKNFENKEKLREIGIRHKKEQRFFLHQVFGIPGKQQGILDAVYQDNLRDRLESSKSEMEDREREMLKRADETYSPKFWPYLKERSEMMASHMVEKVRKEAGMAVGYDGKRYVVTPTIQSP